MIQCIKYLSSLNFINLANDIVANNILTVKDTNSDAGFDQLFKWKSFSNGFNEAKTLKKPVFLMIHKEFCPACQRLKEKFAKCVRLMDISDRFVMVKVEFEGQPFLTEKKFQPDGKYVPRILFYTADGGFIEEAYNKHRDADKEHKYFYSSPTQIIDTMMYVLKKYSKEPSLLMFQNDHPSKPEVCDVDNDIIVPTILH
ncbi:thioredoxin domain-containing protein 12 [Osmia lignaria lignaria]|uniref:thioredoxin domain-containing protein 12 n=1 Tax=Osmia lignaria lignaria TaxID=1437193 RepID=UPI00147893B8|nr:thioredoxin domain-containing protein 12-like [Osmia lignaria]